MDLGQLIDIGISNIFKKHFACFGKLSPKPSHKALMVSLQGFFSDPKLYTETVENSKHHLIKTKILYYTAIL